MDLAARIRRLFGSELADALVPVAAEDGSTRVGGLLAPHQKVIDLVRVKGLEDKSAAYEGICW